MKSKRSLTGLDRREFMILISVALVQLIVMLDGTIVAIALPRIQQELNLSDSARSWAVTIYVLTFGSLLLLGGLLVSRLGMKRALITGLVGFGVSSAFGGVVQSTWELIAARGFQGTFAALMTPAALAILTTTFVSGRKRTFAFALFGTCSGVGAALGLLLGGLLTQYVSWRWTLLLNVPIVVTILLVGIQALPKSVTQKTPIDVLGTFLIASGLGALVYGLTLAEHGWFSPDTLLFLCGGLLLIVVFVIIEKRGTHPLLPLYILGSRTRGVAFLIQGVAGATMVGTMLFVAFHLQIVLGMAPFVAGLATTPQTIAIMFVAGIGLRFLDKFGPKAFIVLGSFVTSAAFFYLAQATSSGSYLVQVLPALILSGVGLGLVFMPMQNLAMRGISSIDAGVAGAALNGFNQIGGSIGLAVFTSLAASYGNLDVVSRLADYTSVFAISAVLQFATGVIALVALPTKLEPVNTENYAAVTAH